MDLHALNIFKSVAEKGSISQAARDLNYAQSNITTKIQQLENDLQTTLFYRNNRGTTLTSKGKVLLTYAENIFNLIEETVKVMQDNQIPQGTFIYRLYGNNCCCSLTIPTIEISPRISKCRLEFKNRYNSTKYSRGFAS